MSYFSVVHQYNISYATFHLSNTDVWSMQCSLLLGRRRHGHCFCSFVRTGLIGTHSRPSRPFLCPNNVIGGGGFNAGGYGDAGGNAGYGGGGGYGQSGMNAAPAAAAPQPFVPGAYGGAMDSGAGGGKGVESFTPIIYTNFVFVVGV